MEMAKMILIISIIIMLLFIVYYIFFYNYPTIFHSLSVGDNKLYSSDNPIIATSDGSNIILYATPEGLMKYDVSVSLSKTNPMNINPIIVTGLAYNGDNFLALDKTGALYNLDVFNDDTKSNLETISLGVQKIYDTIGGFFIMIDNISSSTGSKEPANGNYGLIELIID